MQALTKKVYIISALLVLLDCQFSAVSDVGVCNNAQGKEYSICQGDTLVYTCSITAPLGTTIWVICVQDHMFRFVFDQEDYGNEIYCGNEMYNMSMFTAMNIETSFGLCTNSSLTAIASTSFYFFCYNSGGAYCNVIENASIAVVVPPSITILPNVTQLLVQVNPASSQDTKTIYSITVLEKNISVLNATTNSASLFLADNLTSNTNYTIMVSVVTCPRIPAVTFTKCTLASGPYITVSYDDSYSPISLTWAHMGGCVSDYQVQLMTNDGSLYKYYVSSTNCSHNCSFSILSLALSFQYCIINIFSISDGFYGPPTYVKIYGSYNGVQVQPNLTSLMVTLSGATPYNEYSIELVNISRENNIITSAFFSNLLRNTKYVMNIYTSNGIESRMNTMNVCTLADPPDWINATYDNDTRLSIEWQDVGGCVIQYRVWIVTDNDTVLCDDNITFNNYSLRINEGTRGLVHVYSITAGFAISLGSADVHFPKQNSASSTTTNVGAIVGGIFGAIVGVTAIVHVVLAGLVMIYHKCKNTIQKICPKIIVYVGSTEGKAKKICTKLQSKFTIRT